jgi:hypothetical protein
MARVVAHAGDEHSEWRRTKRSAVEDAEHHIGHDREQQGDYYHGRDRHDAGEGTVGVSKVAWQLSEEGASEEQEEATQHDDHDTENDEELA